MAAEFPYQIPPESFLNIAATEGLETGINLFIGAVIQSLESLAFENDEKNRRIRAHIENFIFEGQLLKQGASLDFSRADPQLVKKVTELVDRYIQSQLFFDWYSEAARKELVEYVLIELEKTSPK